MDKIPRIRDFIQTKEDLFFASTNYTHPEGKIICFLRYIQDENGDRELNGVKYRKVDSDEAYEYLRSNYPEYLFYDEVTNVNEMMGVPIDRIKKIIRPNERLKEIREEYSEKSIDSLEGDEELYLKLIDLCDFFHYIGGIPYENMGISGSICPNLAKKGTSDLDYVIYGLEHHRKAIDTFKKYKDKEVYIEDKDKFITLNSISDEFFEKVFNKRIKDNSLSKEEFVWYENRKSNRGLIENTLFDILATKDYDEIKGYYGDTSFEPQGNATITCTIKNAIASFDNPATYEVENMEHVDGVEYEISELASFTHTYAGEVLEGEEVIARGKVEKVNKKDKTYYRILVGTNRESINEFIKLKESPV